jgi:hypothetical protein
VFVGTSADALMRETSTTVRENALIAASRTGISPTKKPL